MIAKLGSSGSTSIGPHLHFHVADASSLLAAEGMPFVFRQFTAIRRIRVDSGAARPANAGFRRARPGGFTDSRPSPNERDQLSVERQVECRTCASWSFWPSSSPRSSRFCGRAPASAPAVESPQLSYVTTAHQLGVVGYRDPAGAISPDGKRFAYSEGRFIRIVPIGGGAPVTLPAGDGQVRFLEWTSNDTVVAVPRPAASARMADGAEACLADRRLVIPCGGAKQALDPDVDVYGPIAFTANHVYFASPADNGMVALWSADLLTKRAHRVSNFSRDAYAPSSAADGTVVFKVQSYRTHLADVASDGGPTRQLTTFQSETPSYHPTRPLIAFTYGTWRRVVDDAKYPDIAQEIGIIDLSTRYFQPPKPGEVIAKSDSEDQAMAWSPNGKWIAFHSHREMSDDVWLRPVDGSQPDKRITFLGRGAEVGWPRWSPDGKFVLLDGARKSDGDR